MYYIEEIPFGHKTMFRVGNQNGDSVQILPFAGANLHQLVLNNERIIDGAPDLEEFEKSMGAFEGAQLCPFPGRISKGRYSFEGEDYYLDRNDLAADNALHGLVYDKLFTMVDSRIHADSAWISFGYHFEGSEGFPFPFYIETTFTMELDELIIETSLRNLHTSSIPMAHGWHAYFELNGLIDDMTLIVPSQKKMELNNEMIPTGNMMRFTNQDKIDHLELDDCFVLSGLDGRSITELVNKTHRLQIWQETGKNAYNYLVLYTPNGRKKIAIEPMTCAPDGFNQGGGLIIMEPAEEIKLRTGVILQKLK